MKHQIKCAVIAVVLSCATIAEAQTVSETETDGGASNAADPGLSMGTTADNSGQPFVKEVHGDWEIRCVANVGDQEVCQLYQLMRDDRGNAVAEVNIFPLPEGQQAAAGANIITPLETLLTANLWMGVDGGQAKVYPFSFCSQIGCFSRIGFTAEELDAFRAGNTANITIVPAASPNDTVNLRLSLSGFTAGYNALLEVEAPAE